MRYFAISKKGILFFFISFFKQRPKNKIKIKRLAFTSHRHTVELKFIIVIKDEEVEVEERSRLSIPRPLETPNIKENSHLHWGGLRNGSLERDWHTQDCFFFVLYDGEWEGS